jgi:hypothetical protein
MTDPVPVAMRPTYPGGLRLANGGRSRLSYRVACFAVVLACAVALVDAEPVLAQAGARGANAYMDAGAGEIVRLGRERLNTVDRSITRYTTIVQERMSAGIRTGGLSRLLFRREMASRIDWRAEGPVRIEVLGAREALPVLVKGVQIPAGLESFAPHVAFDPADPEVFIRMDTTFLRHPLAADAETHYRFRSGDTTTIRLPDGRAVTLLELVIVPRRDDIHLLSGSFWFDAETHAIVRAVFRPSRPADLSTFLMSMSAELTYVTIEYGLWELRWWLPRVVVAEGVFQAAGIGVPMSYERRYSEYTVEGDTSLATMPVDSASRPCRPPFRMSIQAELDIEDPPPDSVRERRRAEAARARAARRESDPEFAAEQDCLATYDVVIADSSALLASEYLPETVWEGETALLTESELDEIARIVDGLPEAPWQLRAPSFAWGFGGHDLIRYNRVEALSVGAGTELDLGRLTLAARGRIGTADLEPNGEVSIARNSPGGRRRLTGYRRLAATNPDEQPLGPGNTLNAFIWGQDDGQYFRSIGGELMLAPALSSSQWYELRLFGEHQKAAATETDFSLRHLLDDDHVFGPTIAAQRADQYGIGLTLRTSGGIDPSRVRWGLEGGATAETGTFAFVRPWAVARTMVPLAGTSVLLELGAGTSTGEVPVQSLWYLGGPASLRGYNGAVAAGNSFWRTRVELSRGPPAVRLSLFSDAGWAGPRASFGTRNALVSAGIGIAFLDGIVRLDLARALERPTGWRFDMHVSR